MTEIVGGLCVRELAEGGTVFEIKNYESLSENNTQEKEYLDALDGFTKLECLDFGNEYEGEPFDNIAKKMSNLLEDGKIKKRILSEGYGSKPEPLSSVTIHYNAYVQYEAQPFDSTYARKKPFPFTIADRQVLEGLEIAVQSMKLNEKSQFLIDPQLAYRNSGLDRVPPNSTVLFEIELCKMMKSSGDDIPEANLKDFDYVYPFSLGQCVKGKQKFRLKDYHGAIKEYKVAEEKLQQVILKDYEEQLKSDELLVRLYTNLLICYTHVQNPKKGCIFANLIYEMARNKTFKISAKVFFNNAKCLRMLGNFYNAQKKLNKAKNMEPENPEIHQEYLALRKAIEENKKMEKSMAQAFVHLPKH